MKDNTLTKDLTVILENLNEMGMGNTIEKITKECSEAWDWPYEMALDYVLVDIRRRVLQKEIENQNENI